MSYKSIDEINELLDAHIPEKYRLAPFELPQDVKETVWRAQERCVFINDARANEFMLFRDICNEMNN